MAITPIPAAQLVFDESRTSYMAHTIRGVTNHFRVKEKIDLTVLVTADVRGLIKLRAPDKGATSLLMTNFVKGCEGSPSRLLAKIYIHQEANKHLARVCIAHEIFHLLLELEWFKKNGGHKWPTEIKADKAVEDQCNQFAWQLCKLHDDFNRDSSLRENYIFFPKGTFDKPFKLNNTEWYLEWPKDIMLDPKHPFFKREPLPEPIKPPPM